MGARIARKVVAEEAPRNAIEGALKAISGASLALLAVLASDRATGSASVDAASSYLVFPIVAQTASYSSEITIYNPNAATADLVVEYVGGSGTTFPGLRTCTPLVVAASRAIRFDVGTQCSLPGGSHFGMLHVHEPTSATSAPTPVHGYSRVTNPLGLGFSVPAFSLNVFESGVSQVIGLKRKTGTPGFQSNCFVGSVEGDYVYVSLYDVSGAQIGRMLVGALPANTLVRGPDIFAAVGAPAGDYENVRAEFFGYARSYGPPLIAFCTVQDNASFGADFRIAGVTEPYDVSRVRRSVSSGSFFSYGSKHVYEAGCRTSDYLRCLLESSQRSASRVDRAGL